jgi:hypothetical protein
VSHCVLTSCVCFLDSAIFVAKAWIASNTTGRLTLVFCGRCMFDHFNIISGWYFWRYWAICTGSCAGHGGSDRLRSALSPW